MPEGRPYYEDPARDGQAWYVCCYNNPMRYTDPTGLRTGYADDDVTVRRGDIFGPSRIIQTNESIKVMAEIDGQMVNAMAAKGCFFLSCLGIAETAAGVTFSAQEILSIVDTAKAAGVLQADVGVVPGRAADVANIALGAGESEMVATAVGFAGYTGPYDAALVGGKTESGGDRWREADSSGRVVWDPYGAGDVQYQQGREADDYVYFDLQERTGQASYEDYRELLGLGE